LGAGRGITLARLGHALADERFEFTMSGHEKPLR
jgi:hypothetical protein